MFPEVASRQHVLAVVPVIEATLEQAHVTLQDLDAIAVTRGPGLAGSLVVGMNVAKGMAVGSGLPLIGVNHLEGHLYSAWVHKADEPARNEPEFPVVALLVSGGHTELDLMTGHLQYERLGSTLDDAAGEAFDKVARLLGLGYPGGPAIQEAGKNGDARRFNFPRAWLEGTWNFSFSGLKTAVLREVRNQGPRIGALPVADLAASFEAAVVDVLFRKTMEAGKETGARSIIVAGGVSANRRLRETFLEQTEIPVHIPPLWLCTDNAAMIAAAGYRHHVLGHKSDLGLDVEPNWPLV